MAMMFYAHWRYFGEMLQRGILQSRWFLGMPADQHQIHGLCTKSG
jgi:hypothetical protein